MSYIANQYNYATPLSAAQYLLDTTYKVPNKKYFMLSDNTLDGSCYTIVGDVGLMGNIVAGSDGTLSTPYILTVTDSVDIQALRLIGNIECYPVDFVVTFYNEDEVIYTITETNNTKYDYEYFLPSTLTVTQYTVSITKVSKANNIVMLHSVTYPNHIKRQDDLVVSLSEMSLASDIITVNFSDTLSIKTVESRSSIENRITSKSEHLVVNILDDSNLTNVHTIMKSPERQVYGKVYITYTDPMLDSSTLVESSSEAYNSNKNQLLDFNKEATTQYFRLYDNNLTGRYTVLEEDSQVGWVSGVLSNNDGIFDESPSVTISFSARPIINLEIAFDSTNLVKDFVVTLNKEDGTKQRYEYMDNNETSIMIIDSSSGITNIASITVTVSRVQNPNSPAIIIDMPVLSTVLYKGYEDESDIMSIDLLEELTYEDEIEALGGVSANEITVTIDNSDRKFFFNNDVSLVSKYLKRNRKIVPWLGVEVSPGTIEWYTLGTYWSYKWDVPVNGLTASVVGFDTIGLLGTTDFVNHHMQIDKSIGKLIEYVLEDAKTRLNFIEYYIDPSLYDVVIPYAWFDNSSHAAALRKISLCYPMHIYCDRQGRICAMPQKLHLDYYYDVWADDTNVIDKKYSSLYTTLPNIINVQITKPIVKDAEQLVKEEVPFVVNIRESKTYTFSSPYISDALLSIDCDETIKYSYNVYSWGIVIDFIGTGNVRSIMCSGSCLDISSKTIVTQRDEDSIRLDGAVTRNVQSDFIQTDSLANIIISRLSELSTHDKYDASVTYRGDIALSINDPILLLNGIAPDNRYNITRHQLSWSGFLTGSAELNT